ncbi:hypothetical protein [Gordonia neofelifaecis]|uniref:Uncharacterized protein n=1 Tax=Gordonia neofelifaecis NRRL B-59395 TaxID=644548 RepID=F1YJ87_9ACTN|nr:hypothetical protein [Gordonia neofelifaecis]EGD55120.1 hypothetical protein SCNU_09619 [Gordonia neofelifaecis NRRL B-59395]
MTAGDPVPVAGKTSDVATMLGLRNPAAAFLAAGAWLALLFIGVASGGIEVPVAYLAGFALLGGGWFVVLASPSDPMRLPDAMIAALTAAAACGLAVSSTDLGDRAVVLALGGSAALTFVMLAVRGRTGVAWLGGLVSLIAIVVAAAARGEDIAVAVGIVMPGNTGILAMATFFAMLVRPRAQQIGALRRLGERDRQAEGVRMVRDARLSRLQDQVRPLLEYIASGARLSDDQVAACLLIEAGLRDRIRAPGLDAPEVADAAWDARGRGVRVLLLDDREKATWDDESAQFAKVRDAAVGVLVGARAGAQVTVRLLPERRDSFATIAIAEGGQVRRIDFPTGDLGDVE